MGKENKQILNLELMANHRGSLLGGEKKSQPSQKLFESKIYNEISNFNKKEYIFIEAESNKIGSLTIPPCLWKIMKQSFRIVICAKKKHRIEYLMKKYSDLTNNIEELIEKLSMFENIQNSKNISSWKKMAKKSNFKELALDLIEKHYDPRYQNNIDKYAHLFLKSYSINPVKKSDIEDVSNKISLLIRNKFNHQ